MLITKIDVTNFRLLRDVSLSLEERTTVIVGRNNSGKTSLTELFRRILSDSPAVFRLEDFSIAAHDGFWKAFAFTRSGKDEQDVRSVLPSIRLTLTISYRTDEPLGVLGEFIVDLDPSCTNVTLEVDYRLEDGSLKRLFEGIGSPASAEQSDKEQFFRVLGERLPKTYKAHLFAIDPNDPSNRKQIEWKRLRALVQSGFINAQRGLDDTTHRDNDVLGKVLGALFETASADTANQQDRTTAQKLADAVSTIQTDIDTNINRELKELLPAFGAFGYPGLPDPKLRTETLLDVARLLTNHTKIRYPGANGVQLPEAYNGLGARNLIFILLKLYEFFKAYRASQPSSGVHLIFVEEPEAHLHPQMQEVFIAKLAEIAEIFAKTYCPGDRWPVQFVVTTHSSHMANRAPFRATRYFLSAPELGPSTANVTKIKDLSKGIGGGTEKNGDEAFLHQYMTLTRCDLLFADKAILIEGTSERLMLPKMMEKVDATAGSATRLSSQYVSIVEVDGAYAHRFFKLLEFLELRTLIITDLDAVKDNGKGKYVSCKVSEGTRTSNGCIVDWFVERATQPSDSSPSSPSPAIKELLNKTETEKTRANRRLAYQVPEDSSMPCGRSLEDAFILANMNVFGLQRKTVDENETAAYELAAGQKRAKFAFAMEYAIENTKWKVPRYISEGLVWLAESHVQAGAPQVGPNPAPAPITPLIVAT